MRPVENLTEPLTVGKRILTDARLAKGWCWDELGNCDWWDKAEFVLPGDVASFIPDQAVNVEVTGRVVRFDVSGLPNVPVVRVKVTFPGDGEEDVVAGGWVLAAD